VILLPLPGGIAFSVAACLLVSNLNENFVILLPVTSLLMSRVIVCLQQILDRKLVKILSENISRVYVFFYLHLLNREQLELSNKPKKQIVQLSRPVQNYKPKAIHESQVSNNWLYIVKYPILLLRVSTTAIVLSFPLFSKVLIEKFLLGIGMLLT
jgi:hypothetical protein